jgi:excisionase family DNA binding protein
VPVSAQGLPGYYIINRWRCSSLPFMQTAASDILTVREAAVQVGRAPETIRRWIWSGRLAAHKRGNRLMVARQELERIAAAAQLPDLTAWVAAIDSRGVDKSSGRARSAADLVLEDRRSRLTGEGRHAGS